MAESETIDGANPTEEHRMLRGMVQDFACELGEYGLLGISVPTDSLWLQRKLCKFQKLQSTFQRS